MSETPDPAGDATAAPPSPAASGAASGATSGAAPADRPDPHPPRWAWWVAGVVVPLVGALATVLTQTQRTGNASAPPPAQVAPTGVTSTTAQKPGSGTASATPSPTGTTAPETVAPSSAPGPSGAPTRAPETPPPGRPSPTRVPPALRDGTAVAPPVGPAVRIVNGNSGLCLAVPGASTAVVDLNQFGCGPYADHFWHLRSAGADGSGRARYRIVNGNSGYCAAVPGASKASAVNVNQYPCGDYPDHLWRVEYQKRDTAGRPLYRIVNANSGLCLAVPGASTQETAPVNQYPCGPYADHFWRFGQG
ncbi:RICIN domain-containing protein [Streptomyces sp. NPDC002825]|uniref:RICIN domain-containing protein n=1 Tax=Streptomyces sp. NPDC002825 TaxID=3154666 RepID=UPI003317A140